MGSEVLAMDDVLLQRTPRTTAEYKAAIDALLAEMDRLDHKMAQDRIEIDRLKAETAAIKAEGQAIADRTQARLEALQASG
jgi:predicted  nucleic acid-binding Zn-ribbon protein